MEQNNGTEAEFSPYAAPETYTSEQPTEVSLTAPAVLTLVLSIPSCLLYIFSGIVNFVQMAALSDAMDDPQIMGEIIGGVVGSVFLIGFQLLLIVGGINLLKRYSLAGAWATAILNLIPCVSAGCFMGIPVGIWLIVLLKKPGVSQTFTRG